MNPNDISDEDDVQSIHKNDKKEDIDRKLFLNLKHMFDKEYIDADGFKNIAMKYRQIKISKGWHKQQELILKKICANIQTHLLILRPPLIYGNGDLSYSYGPTSFIYKIINIEELILWGDGSEFREFIYVDALVRVVEGLINNSFRGILNIVSGKSYSFNEIIQLLSIIIDYKIKVKSRERTMDKGNHHYSNKLFYNVMGDFQFTNLKNGLKNMYLSIKG